MGNHLDRSSIGENDRPGAQHGSLQLPRGAKSSRTPRYTVSVPAQANAEPSLSRQPSGRLSPRRLSARECYQEARPKAAEVQVDAVQARSAVAQIKFMSPPQLQSAGS